MPPTYCKRCSSYLDDNDQLGVIDTGVQIQTLFIHPILMTIVMFMVISSRPPLFAQEHHTVVQWQSKRPHFLKKSATSALIDIFFIITFCCTMGLIYLVLIMVCIKTKSCENQPAPPLLYYFEWKSESLKKKILVLNILFFS